MTWQEAEKLLHIALECRRERRLTCYEEPQSEPCLGCPTFTRLEALVFSGTWTEEKDIFHHIEYRASAPSRN